MGEQNRKVGMDRREFIVATAASVTVLLRKSFFSVALASAVPTLASAFLAMFPLACPAQQQVLLQVHRISALLLVGSGLLFAYYAMAAEWNHRRN